MVNFFIYFLTFNLILKHVKGMTLTYNVFDMLILGLNDKLYNINYMTPVLWKVLLLNKT